MTALIWATVGAFAGGPLSGLLLHWLLSNRSYGRGVAEGRRLTQIEFGLHEPLLSDNATLLLLRRSPNEQSDQFVTRVASRMQPGFCPPSGSTPESR